MRDEEFRVDRIRGKGPGGQHRNKTSSCIRLTHVPTGITVVVDGRKQHQNLAQAKREIQVRLADRTRQERARKRKDRRDRLIRDCPVIRTYDFKSQLVTDHRTGRRASLREVLGKGRIGLLR